MLSEEGHSVYDSIHMKCPEEANSQGENVNQLTEKFLQPSPLRTAAPTCPPDSVYQALDHFTQSLPPLDLLIAKSHESCQSLVILAVFCSPVSIIHCSSKSSLPLRLLHFPRLSGSTFSSHLCQLINLSDQSLISTPSFDLLLNICLWFPTSASISVHLKTNFHHLPKPALPATF